MIEVKGQKKQKVFDLLAQGLSKEEVMDQGKINLSSYHNYNSKFRKYMEEAAQSKKPQFSISKAGDVVAENVTTSQTNAVSHDVVSGSDLIEEIPAIHAAKIKDKSFIRVDGVAGIINDVDKESISYTTHYGYNEVTAREIKAGKQVEVYNF